MPELSDALGRPRELVFDGRAFVVKPLDFNALAVIEDKYGSLESLTFERASQQRFLLWVILSASDSTLTERAVGEMLTLEKMDQAVTFITEALRLSGLAPGEVDAKKTPARTGKA